MPIRSPEIECMPREELKKLQSERLVAQISAAPSRTRLRNFV